MSTVPPSPFTRLLHLTSPPPPRFTMGGIDVRVRSIHDIDMVGREEARVCGRDEGRAQQRGGPAHGSLLLVWGSLAACFPVRLASVAELPCAVERCVPWRSGTAVPSRSGPKAGASRRARPLVNSARPPPEVSGVDRRILRTNDLGPGLLVPYATLAIILACEAKAGLALLPSLAERLPRHSCSTHCWAPFPALQDASAAPQWPQRESAHGERARTRRTRTLG